MLVVMLGHLVVPGVQDLRDSTRDLEKDEIFNDFNL